MKVSVHKKQKANELSDLYKAMKQNEAQEKREHSNLLMRLGESLNLTEDMIGEVIVTVYGKNQLLINNYRSITEYTTEKIRLQAKRCEICIEGVGLKMEYFMSDEIKIRGEITGISYVKKKL